MEDIEETSCGLVQTTSHLDQIDYDCARCGYSTTIQASDRHGPDCGAPDCNPVMQAADPEPGAPTQLFGGADMRCETLVQAMRATLYERGAGLPVPLVLGAIRILEHQILKEAHDG